MMNKMEPRDGLTLPDAPRPQVTLGVTRGVVRLLWRMGFSPLTEFTLTSSRRVDVAGLDRQGRFLFVEVKSSAEDFRADGKWHAYRDFCDGFYFAVPPGFPNDI
ncbi:MAG: MmcB family DNA repair protein, partial [Rhodospirillales bacterium]